MKRGIEAYLTVYLSLTIGVLLTVIVMIVEVVRRDTIKMEIETVMEVALFSIFGEYHRELLEQYDLFAIDTGYRKGNGKIEYTEEHLQYYMNQNFKKIPGLKKYDLTDLHCDNAKLTEYCFLSDEDGKVLKEAILSYMKDKIALGTLEDIKREYGILIETEQPSYDLEGEWQKAERQIWEKIKKRDEEWEKEEPPPPLENPTDYIKEIKEEGTFGLALPPDKKISTLTIDPNRYISKREIQKGTGKIERKVNLMDIFVGKSLLCEYFFEKCGSYHEEKKDSYLKYQIEYLLHGKTKDQENLEKTVQQILLIREGINITYLLTDDAKMAEAEAAALAISTFCLLPELKDPIKMILLFAWSYAESVQDLRILLDGNKISVLKNTENWNTPFSQLLSFTSHLDEYKSDKQGMGYEDYLKLFLYMKNDEEILMKFMDLCEMDIQYSTGNGLFHMDECITELKARSSVSSGYGEGYSISRSWYYE